ncbi:MAG: YhcH/YjgK/YiaL family protein [Ignavibacteriales bacterium]|nr:YhcH/YjgK/YiaL family protein [Ignavibacteriales bacterium]MCF8305545.1 YhcH/YjgK/YiaL family protein [Ignavibacteriales bacterium]MCF8315267.1 YhcH/YjgK/YiaL family protein [Ignavibacteriales bacterium]MCF8436841.1 YhcH/YjgK/YiaL family protein [Ignavibacteriales bacterium]
MALFLNIDEIIKESGSLDESLIEGLRYLSQLGNKDFDNLRAGETNKVFIDDDRVFAINQVYVTSDAENRNFEAHVRNIDIHFVFEGKENIRIAEMKNSRVVQEYSYENDFGLYSVKESGEFLIEGRSCIVIYPGEVHLPGIACRKGMEVKKTVIKVRSGSSDKE